VNRAAAPSRRTLNAAIAAELVVSPGAVEKHVAGIFAKLGLPL
jgi:DNA-binding NarL/FixJ family response regulator